MRCAPCAGEPLSKWLVGHALGKAADLAERRAVFVDEISCIGCKQCVWCGARPAGPHCQQRRRCPFVRTGDGQKLYVLSSALTIAIDIS